ncbi:Anaphase-promoting complex subunit 1, partial [Toxocara canis]
LEASPRLASFYREHGIVAAIDMRGSELELIAPEICMESIWIEPHRRQADDMPCKMPATIAFFTTDLIGQNFVCFYSSEWEILKCVRIISHDDGSFTAIRGFTTIKCISATNIKGRRLMAVVEKDQSTVLYTGVCRLGTLYVQHTPIEHSLFSSTPAQSPTAHESASSCCVTMCAPVRSVYPFRRGHFIVEGKDCVYSICRVAPSTSCNFVDECLEHVCSLLPNDRALKFASSWVLANNWRLLSGCRGNRLSLEMALFIQFLLSKCGVNIHNFPYFSEIEKLKVQCASSAGDAKKKRTAMADRSSLWEYMLSRESADTGYAQTETKWRRQYSVDISEEAELHSHARFMLSGLHASYEHAKMDTRLAFLTPMMASALHALSTIFALPAYVKYYREDFADLVNDAFEFRSDAAKGDLSSMRRLSERVPSLHGSVLRVLEERCLVGSLSCPTKCLPIVVLIAIGLGKIRNTFELQRAVGKNWEKKLGLSELDASFLFDTLDSIRGSPGDKCRSCARLFNVSEHFLMNLPPSVALLVCEILYDDRLLALNFFCPVPVVKPYRMLPSEEEIYRTVRFRWKYDMRFTNAMQMLDSSHPIFIPANNGVSEMEQRDMQEQMLTVVNMRTLTQCFGRAAIEFRHLVPPMNMPLSVPELCLQGRLHPCNMPFEMQHTEASKVMIEWGAFYNGVAAGLRVGSERSCNLDGEWLALSVSEQIEKLKVQCASSAGDAKKKRTAMADRSSLWEYMLSRESADTGYAQTETKWRRQYSVDISEEAELHSHARFMLSGLHASYEHAKMDTRLAFLTPMMASALHALSTIFALPAYVKYYREDFADLVNDAFEFRSDAAKGDLSSMRRLSERVPSLHGSVLRVLEERCLVGSLSCPTKCLPIVVLIAIGLGKIRNTFELQRAVGKNWEKKLGLSELDASFLFDTLDSIRGSPGDKCRSCARLFNVSEHFLMNLPPSVALLVCEILYDDRLLALNFFCPVPVVKPYRMLPSEEEIYRTVRFRWKYDMRFTNAMQMLDSSHPIFIPANNGVSEMEQRDMQEQMLTVVNMRTLTQCFGRAAIEFRHLVPPMNMPLSVPELCLQGRLHPCNMPFEMQHTEASKVMIEWGAFYNGVAAGLRVGSERSCNLDGEWLALSVSEQKGSASAGMIYAFGLNGHMAKINLFTIHELLSAGDRLMSASVLLGYAANMLATGDRQIYKVLVTHLPFMMGPTLLELHIDPMVQTAALVGLGLLFAKSSHLGILSLLLNEIGKPAPLDQEPWTDRYSYTLAVGFAVGLISLGQGEQLSADIPFMERYPSLQSRLLLMMEGGPRSLCVFPTNAPTDILPPGTTDSVNANVPQMSNHVMEFDNVNPHLSSKFYL